MIGPENFVPFVIVLKKQFNTWACVMNSIIFKSV
jgi:hypothetical protein